MLKKIFNLISNENFLEEDSHSFDVLYDDDSVTFSLKPELWKILKNQTLKSKKILTQYFCLKSLDEQSLVQTIPHGYEIPAHIVCHLGNDECDMLDFPTLWTGKIYTNVTGETTRSDFKVNLSVSDPDGNKTNFYKIEGAFIKFGSNTRYRLTSAQFSIFTALKKHQDSDKAEKDNLEFIAHLQNARKNGAKIDLMHFAKMDILIPNNISISGEFDNEGNLNISPSFGQKANTDKINKTVWQLGENRTLRVGEEIILFDENKLKSVHEILKNKRIPKEHVKQFLETPSAYIDATLVDFDQGFSIRVKGATLFKHAYFGETDQSKIDWFGKPSDENDLLSIQDIFKNIAGEDEYLGAKVEIENALHTGAQHILLNEKEYDLSDRIMTQSVLDKIDKAFEEKDFNDDCETNKEDSLDDEDYLDNTENEIKNIVVDIDLNDDEVSEQSLDQKIHEISYKEDLNWDNYARMPFEHQETGIRWALGLLQHKENNSFIEGGLLADDMGLGKTFMALSFVDHYYKWQKVSQLTKKPTLIVAPLSLLENWHDETSLTFNESPFSDVVILQSDKDLKKFRTGGAETRGTLSGDGENINPKFSLKIGTEAGVERLDMPARLVITTYQTLRDYQFSMCKIDWGIVVFDEAQNINNPNALQTRASKGLKSDFKILATGTPVENSLTDFWCLMDTACPSYLGSYQEFRKQYITPILQAASDEIHDIRLEVGRLLRDKTGSFMLRRTKEDNLKDIPRKNIFVGLEQEGLQYLDSLKSVMHDNQLMTYDQKINTYNDSENKKGKALGIIQGLRDICLHPSLVNRGHLDVPTTSGEAQLKIKESAKLESLMNTLDDIRRRDEKVIIFCVNKRLQVFLKYMLQVYYKFPSEINLINGDTKAVAKSNASNASLTRKGMIKEFESVEGFNIIIMSPVAAGVGLTVTGANNVIHYERHWNPAKEAQATDRVYRIGQKKDVNIYIPILHHPSKESFDVNLHGLLSRKINLKEAVVTPEDVLPMPDGVSNYEVQGNSFLSIHDVKKLSWQEFEALCVELIFIETKGIQAYLTNKGSDSGADGIIVTENHFHLIQAKHTKSAYYRGDKPIREVYASEPKYKLDFKGKEASLFFITNAIRLDPKTRKIAKEYNVNIIDGGKLRDLLEKYKITYEKIIRRLEKKRWKV